MNLLFSLNGKVFLKYNENELINTIVKLDKNKVLKGAEIYIDMNKKEEQNYCEKLAELMKDNNMILQIHSADMNSLNNNTIKEYLEYYNKLSLVYGKTIKLTIHPAAENSLEYSINKTIEVFNYINKYVKDNNLNLEILIENLNKYENKMRCNISQIYEIIDKLNIDGITLDMGHYVYDYSNDYINLNNKYVNKIKNIHLHDINGAKDHFPFYYNNVKIKEAISYLKSIDYKENIVLEFGIEYLNGNTLEDKIDEYVKQAQYAHKYTSIC